LAVFGNYRTIALIENTGLGVNECNGDFSPAENYANLSPMPTARLRSVKGQEFLCSLCETKFKAKAPQPKQAKVKDL
jgi:hypothetical protein